MLCLCSATCSSNNIIYLTRESCSTFSVGKSTQKLKERITEHTSEMKPGIITNSLAKHQKVNGNEHYFTLKVMGNT